MHQRASWNPARRNRRTGTAASGYKRRAPFAIPAPFGRQREPRAFHEQLHSPVIVWRQVAGHSLCFAVEPPHLPGVFFIPARWMTFAPSWQAARRMTCPACA